MHSKLFDIHMEETMIHYLKKQWRLSTLTGLFAIIAYGAQALIQLALMKVFDAVVLLDLRSTIFGRQPIWPVGGAIFFLLLYRNIVRPKLFAL